MFFFCFFLNVYLLVTVKNVLYFWVFKQSEHLFSLLNFHFLLIIVSHKYMLTPILFVVSIFYRSFLSMQSICGMMRGWRPVSSAQTSISSSTVHSSEYLLIRQLYSYSIVLSTLIACLCSSYVMFAMWRFLVVCSTTQWIMQDLFICATHWCSAVCPNFLFIPLFQQLDSCKPHDPIK